MLAIRLPAAIEKRLDRLAKRTGRDQDLLCPRSHPKAPLRTWKQFILRKQDLQISASGRTRTIPIENVMRRYGLEPEEVDD